MPSWKKIIVSGSNISQLTNDSGFAKTGSANTFYNNQTINGDLIVTGSITALQYIVSSSVIYITESNFSGSNVFGNTMDDIHQFTGSVYITGSTSIVGNINLNTQFPLIYNSDTTNNMLYGFFDGGSIYGPYLQIFGNQYTNASQRGGAEIIYDIRNGGDGNFHVSSYNGSSWTQKFRVDDNGAQVTGSLNVTNGITGSLFGTASYVTGSIFTSANPALSASYALSSSYSISSSFATTSSYAQTSSYVNPLNQNVTITGSLLVSQSHISTVDYIDFVSSSSPSHLQGRIHWDANYGTLNLDLAGTNSVMLKTGLDNLYYIKNQTGTTLSKGQVIRASGTLGSSGRITGATMIADNTIPYYYTLGIAAENIIDGNDGYVYEFGLLRGIQTNGANYGESWVDGDILYVSPTTAGGLTKVEPTAPNLKIQMAIVINAQASNGSIFIRPDLRNKLNDLHNVKDTSSTDGDLLVKSGSVWINTKQLTGSYGLTGSLTFTNGGITGSLLGTASTASYYNGALSNTQLPSQINVTGVTASFNGSLFGTSSWANQAITASFAPNYVLNSATSSFVLNSQTSSMLAPYVLNSSTSSFVLNSSTSSFVLNSQTSSMTVLSASFAGTASYVNTLNQSVIISGSTLSIIPTTLAGTLTENVLIIGPASSSLEGGQLILQAPGGTYTSASMLDNYTNYTRLLRGSNNGSDAIVAQWNMHTKQMQMPAYNSLNAFSGTPVAALGVNSSGDIITIQTGSGAGSGGGSTFQAGTNIDNRLITATGASPELNGEANLTFDGSSLTVTGQITASGAIRSTANNQMYFRGGDDAEFWDINIANTVGIYGQQTQGEAGLKLGSGGATLYGSGSRFGIGTTGPVATLDVNGNLYVAAGITGSLFGTSSWATNALTASFAPNYVLNSVTSSMLSVYVLNSQTSSFVTNSQTSSFVTNNQTSSFVLNSQTSSMTVLSSSFAYTASYYNGTVTNSQLPSQINVVGVTASLQGTASWASNALSASATPNALITASVSTNVITFTKGNGTTFNLTVNTGSGAITTPGGSNTYIQFNSASAFNGSQYFRYIITSNSFQHGYGTTAFGMWSHAEGVYTTATGDYSHAEGISTNAIGNYSHAEGQTSYAYAQSSHAEGANTTVSVNALAAHAEGYYTIASASFSHAEGANTQAKGESSHAEGYYTITDSYAYASHAEGRYTLASGSYSHAEGTNLVIYPLPIIDITAITSATFDFGTYAIVLSNGTDMVIAGDITGDIPGGAPPDYTLVSLDITDGVNTITVEFGYYGSPIITSAVYDGGTNQTTLTFTGLPSFYQNVELGASPTAYGFGSHVEGFGTTAYGVASHAEGYNTQTIGKFSHADGANTIASGAYSYAGGSSTQAIGVSSFAIGQGTKAYGDYSFAQGNTSIAIGLNSFAIGGTGVAYGDQSFVHGGGTIASGSNQAVFGYYNKHNNTTDLFVIGNGTTNVNRQDIFNVSTTTITMSGSVNISGSLLINGSAPGGGTPLATLVQSTPSSTWTFTHGLGVSNPIVTIYDSSNKVIIPQEVSASNSNTLIITFPTTVAGTAVAAGGTFVGATPNNAVTASYVLNAVSASYVLNAISSSYAATASLAPNYVLNSATSSFVLNSQTASFVTNSQTASFVINSQTSSFVTNSQTSSFATTGSNTFNGDQTINGDLIFSPPASGFNGEIVKFGAGTLTTGQVYFLSSSGTWSLADASSVSSSIGMLGIAVGSSPTSNGLLIRGYAASSSYTQSTGSVLYVNTTAGGITETAPSTTNQVVRVVGYKTTISNTIYFMPDATWVTLA